jgi:hypothetical protein
MNDPSIPAGWYPDPQTADRNRYWDGEAWTEATSIRPDAVPPAWGQPPASGATPPSWSGFPAAAASPAPAWTNGTPQTPGWPQQGYGLGAGGSSSHAPGLPAYYERAFTTIDRGQTKVVWNWAAFLLGAFWYLYRGMWVKAILYVAIALLSGGFLALPIWIYGGVMGTYDLWLLHRKGTQAW